jgi:cytochrome c553
MGAMLRAVLLLAALGTSAAFAQSTFRGDAVKGAAKAKPCLACHGAKGQPAVAGAPSLGGQPPEYLVLQMFVFREGLRDVPQMAGVLKGVTDAEFNDMAAYFTAQPPATNKSKPDAKLRARGDELARGMGCASCHMAEYIGQREVPRLAGQAEDYLVASMQAYRDNKRVGTDTNMNGIMSRVNDADIRALAHLFAHR